MSAPRHARSRGFTLLEVLLAVTILAMAMFAIFRLNSGAIEMNGYTKRLSVASLLARSKMTDIEQELYDKGFSVDDQEESGDFNDEGWSSFKWKAKIIAPKTQGLTPEQVITALFNIPMGAGGLSALFGGGDGGIGALSASSSGVSASGAAAANSLNSLQSSSGMTAGALGGGASAAGGLGALGGMGGLIEGQFTQMLDQLGQAVREVHLSVYWKDGKRTDSIDLVTHVVAFGTGGDRNTQPDNGATQAQAAAAQANGTSGSQSTGVAGSGLNSTVTATGTGQNK